ncbi:hypothetical protein EIP91_005139 [Steccherinum ochraceum]|uniref:Cell wall galactomannoprotein n=1 Tax=Steccherinum ochraceum TaxID=92696 RepID=A0A4R0RG01_9APHY|nr:hypothetical protein EIP91_005139 [Steccherinum ochraceum]
MLSRVGTTFFALLALTATVVGAAPSHLSARQVGGLQCNIDRVQIAGSIFQALITTKNLTEELSSDPVGSAAMTNVTAGLYEVIEGFAAIATAIFTGSKAPSDARDQVGEGVVTAFTAANQINSTDPAVVANVAQLKDELIAANTAGDDVVQDCN